MPLPFEQKNDELQIMLHQPQQNVTSLMHFHDSYEIFILEDGECLYMLENSPVFLKPRDVILIKRENFHYIIGESFTGTLLNFSDSYINKFFSLYGKELIIRCFDKNVIRVSNVDFGSLLYSVEKLSANYEDISALIQLLTILENNMSKKAYDLKGSNTKISFIIDFIAENYKNIDSLDVIANKFYISKSNLCKIFKEHTDTSIMKYVNYMKIQFSIELLSNKELTLTEVAEQSGFGSLSHFSKTFNSVMGMTPKKYRKING